jgi:ATPase subunit of ABC transporter with duplicated ATPase domains
MLSGASVLMLDQPTNHLDLESIAALNNGLTDFKGNIIFTTHDHQMIDSVANRIIEFTGDKVIDRSVTYEEYIELMRAQNQVE